MSWAEVSKVNGDFLNAPLDLKMHLEDYKLYGEDSYVFQQKELLHGLYECTYLSMNDRRINGETLEYFLKNNKHIGEALIAIFDLDRKDVVKTLRTMTAIANSPAAMTAIANSPTAMTAIANSPAAMTAIANSPAAMTAIANSPTAMTAIANSKLSKTVTHIWRDRYQNIGVNRCIITGWKMNMTVVGGTYSASFNKLFYGSNFSYDSSKVPTTEFQNILLGLDAPCQTMPLINGSNTSYNMTFRYIEIN